MIHRLRPVSGKGSSYVAGDLASWSENRDIIPISSAPNHPTSQGKIEHWHQTLKTRILLENDDLPGANRKLTQIR